MSDFRIRPLHRQRTGRRRPVEVLNQRELAERLGVPLDELRARLDALGWAYHVDSAGALWATVPDDAT